MAPKMVRCTTAGLFHQAAVAPNELLVTSQALRRMYPAASDGAFDELMSINGGSETGRFRPLLITCGRSEVAHRLWTMNAIPTLRVGRPTDDIEALLPFYRDGLGFDVLYWFVDHDGFDGIMLGRRDAPYHFEFTKAHGHAAGRAPTQDHLLILYLPDAEEWQAAVDRMEAAGLGAVPAFNAYWDQHGRTFEDPDGYRVVIQNAVWKA